MASTFAPRLVNGPFGDPGLFVELRWQGSAVLFDLGRNDGLPAADLLKVTHVFVSHTHMDHFIGFDRVLRLFLNRDKDLALFGPAGILDCVAGKLAGYVWNLTDDYPFAFDVTEVTSAGMTMPSCNSATTLSISLAIRAASARCAAAEMAAAVCGSVASSFRETSAMILVSSR